TNSPTSNNPPLNFGFMDPSGPQTGTLMFDILTPNNQTAGPSFGLTGTLTGTATLFNATAWANPSQRLDQYLGIDANRNNQPEVFLPRTVDLDPGATGFFVYQVSFPDVQVLGSSNQSPLENFSSGILPKGSYIVAFLNTGTAANPNWIGTPNSSAIFVN